jgi:N-methylhydantoinase B/oxoprolinase/acetone carboxylase alpha subunit
MSLEGDGHRHPPPGIFGGRNGYPGAVTWIKRDGTEIPLPSKLQSRWAEAGDTVRTVSPNAAGYGDPLERDPQRVLDDVLDEVIPAEDAPEVYGVVLDLDHERVDEPATVALRERLVRERA